MTITATLNILLALCTSLLSSLLFHYLLKEVSSSFCARQYLPALTSMSHYIVCIFSTTSVFSTNLLELSTVNFSGSIVVTKMRVRRSSQLMESDPYTIIVALDEKVSDHVRECDVT